ncbi:FG-GAP repeat protein [Pseudoalteromonas rubra]|uniref:FG-GAP repeat protein n=1 Tax=Pseudoalteromonas rubra TaxID=43658 RepID=UPI0020160AD9|nr:FG-GAP repeat protein [Pseudoalteromonas rubra]
MTVRSTIKLSVCVILTALAGHSVAQDRLLANDGKAQDYFGYGAAIDGNTVLVGAHQADVNGIKDGGVGYVYVLGDKGWQQQGKLVAEPLFADGTLGGKVVLNNNIAMLGGMRRDDKGEDAGAVVAFERNADTWTQTQIFTAPDAKPGDAFGQSLALTDTTLVIGAPRNDTKANDAGAAYIFQRTGNGWRYHSKIMASDGTAGDLFGIDVAVDGNTIVVGADLHDKTAENAGAVYVYVLKDNQWQQQAKLMASDGGDTDIFGVRVAISGDTALISARRDDVEGLGVDAGSAYIFERNGTRWTEAQKLTSPDGAADDRFGRGVALSGDMAIISAMNHDAQGKDTGALYVYKKRADGWYYSSKVVAKNAQPGDQLGWNVGLSDGKAVIATPHHDANGKESGAVYVQDLNQYSAFHIENHISVAEKGKVKSSQ